MKHSELLELMQHFDASGLSRIKFEYGGAKIMMEKGPYAPPACAAPSVREQAPLQEFQNQQPSTEKSTCIEIKAPLVGVFYAAPTPGASAFIKEGQKVKKGQTLCLIEAMKMMNELTCPQDGTLSRILANNEDVISFGQVLFEVEPC